MSKHLLNYLTELGPRAWVRCCCYELGLLSPASLQQGEGRANPKWKGLLVPALPRALRCLLRKDRVQSAFESQ